MIREKLPSVQTSDYIYDTYGNLRSKKTIYSNNGTYEQYSYTYGNASWKDQLTAISYRDTNGVTHNGTFSYDVDGIRDSKTVKTQKNGTVTENVRHDYTTLGGKIVREAYGQTVIDYFYDQDGRPYKIVVKNGNATVATGYFVLNLQGDVIAIVDSNGAVAVEYEYDAWGKEIYYDTHTDQGNILYQYNALKYRGYYYDSDLGLYYLNNRFYDQEIGRFINADTVDLVLASQTTLTDKNLYAYCDNNPIIRIDSNGEFWTIASGALIGAVISAGIEFGMQVASGGKINVFNIGLAALGGAAGGALAASSFGYVGQVIGNAAISGVSEVISQLKNGNRDLESIVLNAGKMAAIGAASVVIGGKGIKAKGTPYANSLNNLNSVKGNVSQAISNPSIYKQQINSVITTHQVTSRAAVKSTTKSFAQASFFSNFAGRAKNFFAW